MRPYAPIIVHFTANAKKDISVFKKNARGRKYEILGILVGRLNVARQLVTVEGIEYPEGTEEHRDHVSYSSDIFSKVKNAIGTIHSHPEREPGLSKEDMVTQATDGDIIFAIYSWWLKKGRIHSSLDIYSGSPRILLTD